MDKIIGSDWKHQHNDVDKEKSEQQHLQQRELVDAISRLAPLDDIRIMLAGGAQVDRPVTQGLRPIHYAAYQNYVEAVKLLLVRGCNIDAMDENSYSAVHLAAERGYYELLEFLISKRARINFTDLRKKNTPVAIPDEPLSLAIKRNHLNCAELLLKNGADPNASYFMGYEINFVGVSKIDALKLLLKYGADPNTRDRAGLTPLMKAARHPHGLQAVKLLVDHGADVNDITVNGARYPSLLFDKPSPLDIAIISGRQDVVRLLIEYDADVNAGADSTFGQPLQTALTQKIEHKFEIVELLLHHGADPNSLHTSRRKTGPPIHDYLNSTRACSSLISFRSNSPNGSEPDVNMLRLLLRYGARFILTTVDEHRLGIVKDLVRIQDDLSMQVLYLIIQASEQVNWSVMYRLIYYVLKKASNRMTNELPDPSSEAQATPDQLINCIKTDPICSRGLGKILLDLIKNGEHNYTAMSLRQIVRIQIRRHFMQDMKLNGCNLIIKINGLPLPSILKSYLLYQDG